MDFPTNQEETKKHPIWKHAPWYIYNGKLLSKCCDAEVIELRDKESESGKSHYCVQCVIKLAEV